MSVAIVLLTPRAALTNAISTRSGLPSNNSQRSWRKVCASYIAVGLVLTLCLSPWQEICIDAPVDAQAVCEAEETVYFDIPLPYNAQGSEKPLPQ